MFNYKNDKWGFEFAISDGVNLYTYDNPGPMASKINSATPLWLVNSSLASERINVKVSSYQDATESELNELKQMLDNKPHPLKGYQKISVNFIKIGKQKNKTAVEHVHALKQRDPKKISQVTFIHKGRPFVFTCTTSPERFDVANNQFFDLIFRTMEFK